VEETLLGVIATCLIALFTWLWKLGKWQGRIEQMLRGTLKTETDVEDIKETLEKHENRLTTLETTCNIRHPQEVKIKEMY
jgi:hypothetical protein